MARPQWFVFASDSLKGTIASARAAQLLETSARRHFPECECRSVPMADGGDGTAEAVALACGGELRQVCVHDPLGRTVEAAYAMLPDGRAVVEMAAASGLPLLSPSEKNPLLTSTYGTGELIRSALDAGAHNVDLAIGGSATNDGGMGCMRALGARFLDTHGRELAGRGSDLARVAAIDLSRLDPRVARTEFHLMCDVDNPLTGPDGASAVYGPQKGATPEMVAELDAGMANYARVLAATFGRDFASVPGAGAAGGLGAGAMAFLGARVESGIARVLELTNFSALLEGADLCVTGEGHADAQTARGKVVAGVAAACAAAGVPCVAVVGGMSAGAARLPGLTAVVPTAIDAMPLERALAQAEELYALAADRLFSLLALGTRL